MGRERRITPSQPAILAENFPATHYLAPKTPEATFAFKKSRGIERITPKDIRDNLLPASLVFFNKLTRAEQLQYHQAMNSVVRMQSARDKGFPIPQGFIETNLDHIKGINGMISEYANKYPALRESIDFGEVQIYALVHDLGESVPFVGDQPPIDRTDEQERRKALEKWAAKKYVMKRIGDPDLRQKVLEYYEEYMKNDPANVNVQMARFIDKAQGTTRVAEIVFNASKVVNDEATLNKMRLHLWQTVPRMVEPASNLFVALEEKQAKEDMRSIILGELDLLKMYAPSEVAKAFIKGFAA